MYVSHIGQLACTVRCIYQHASSTILYALLLQGVPEDLLFFYQSIRRGRGVFRVDQCLLVYRYHEKATTHSVSESVPLPCSMTASTCICSGLVDPCCLPLVSWCHMTSRWQVRADVQGSVAVAKCIVEANCRARARKCDTEGKAVHKKGVSRKCCSKESGKKRSDTHTHTMNIHLLTAVH